MMFSCAGRLATIRNHMINFLHSSTNSEIVIDKIGEVTTIGINRPKKRNCVDIATAKNLWHAFSQFENDNTSKVAVLHGIGGNFCSGYDLGELANNTADHVELPLPLGPTRTFLNKPLVGAISGYAVGAGLELALFCDLRIVEETAIMGMLNRRFGVPSIDGCTVRLQALIGLSRAMDLILTGRSVKAEEALQIGLANRLVACGTALDEALILANSLAKFPQAPMLGDRESTYYSAFSAVHIKDALSHENEMCVKQVILKDAVEGAKKFKTGVGKHGSFTD